MMADRPGRKTWLESHVAIPGNLHHSNDFARWSHASTGSAVCDRPLGTATDQVALEKQQLVAFIRILGLRPDDPLMIVSTGRWFVDSYGVTQAEVTCARAMCPNTRDLGD